MFALVRGIWYTVAKNRRFREPMQAGVKQPPSITGFGREDFQALRFCCLCTGWDFESNRIPIIRRLVPDRIDVCRTAA